MHKALNTRAHAALLAATPNVWGAVGLLCLLRLGGESGQ